MIGDRIFKLILTVFILAMSSVSFGFSLNDPVGAQPVHDFEIVAKFSKDVERLLASKRARIAIISRAGRHEGELPDGVEFTHVGLAVYSTITDSHGRKYNGYAIHNLYQREDALDKSELVQDFPFDFYRSATTLKTGIIIPNDALQSRLLNVIQSGGFQRLHNPDYSAIANPFNNRKQNCTELVLNVLQSAIYQTEDLVEIKTSIKEHFDPYKIAFNPVKIIIGAAFSREISATDHDGTFMTTTWTSIKHYMQKFNLASEVVRIDRT